MKRKTFFEWKVIAQASKEIDFDIMKAMRPVMVGKRRVMENLDDLTMGQMLTLSGCNDSWALFYLVCHELLGMDEQEVNEADAAQVVLFVGWVSKQIDGYNKMLARIHSTKTAEEIRAGVEKLDFGAFGLVDWYAKRMGIVNHDDVMSVPFLRVYQCLKMDVEREEYEKRLAKIYRSNK